MRKIFAVVLVVCLLLPFVETHAQDNYFELTYMLDKEANTLDVLIDLKKANSICGFGFNVTYDNAVLSVLNSNSGEIIVGKNILINNTYAEKSIRVVCAGVTPIEKEGNLVKISFSLIKDALDTQIKLENIKISDNDEIQYKIDDIISNVTLSSDNEAEITPTPKPSHSSGTHFSSSVDNTHINSNLNPQNQSTASFEDVKVNDWFYKSVKYIVDKSLMKGVSDTEFAPNNALNRAMLVTILYRNEGEPIVDKQVLFADVGGNAYYADAVFWAKHNGIVNGITENEFAPNSNITREQIATIIYRYAQYKGYDVSVGGNINILSYNDAKDISGYALTPMQYMVEQGFINGKSDVTLNPKDNATRAEISAILQRFIEANKAAK